MLCRRVLVVSTLGLLLLGACQRSPKPEQEARSAPEAAPPPALPSARPSAALPNKAPPAASSLAAPPPLPAPEPAPPLPKALALSPPRPASSAHAGFVGPVSPAKDRAWIESLASAPIVRLERNPGGATLTLRVRLGDGHRAVIKPEQKHSASNLRSEIAAYHLDRILGFGRTAVVVGRSLGLAHVREHLRHVAVDEAYLARFDDEVVAHDGRVSTAVIAWHSGRLVSAEPPRDWTKGLRSEQAVPEDLARRLPEWSDMVVFDFLIDNTDRWSGGNVLTLGAGGPLIFLDNAAGFAPWRAARGESLQSRLEPLCRFRRATVDALESVGPNAPVERRLGSLMRSSLSRDPLAPVLSERQLAALDRRVEQLLAHVERCKAELGEEVVLSL